MKRILAVAALVFTTGVVAALPPEDVAKELIKLENDWAKAQVAGDAAALEKQLTPDYTYTNQDGQVVSRADLVAGAKSGANKYQTYTVEDMKVRVHGDAAVVTGKGHAKGTENGKAIDETMGFTDTWVKHDGRWLCAATHVSRIPMK